MTQKERANFSQSSAMIDDNGFSSESARPTVTEILELVTQSYKTTLSEITDGRQGTRNMPRLVSVYCLWSLKGMDYQNIARVIQSPNPRVVAQILIRAKRFIRTDKLAQGILTRLQNIKNRENAQVARSNGQGLTSQDAGSSTVRG